MKNIYANFEIKKLDDGHYAAFSWLNYSEYGIDNNIMLCDGDSEEDVRKKLELMKKAFEYGAIVGRNDEKKRIIESLGLNI